MCLSVFCVPNSSFHLVHIYFSWDNMMRCSLCVPFNIMISKSRATASKIPFWPETNKQSKREEHDIFFSVNFLTGPLSLYFSSYFLPSTNTISKEYLLKIDIERHCAFHVNRLTSKIEGKKREKESKKERYALKNCQRSCNIYIFIINITYFILYINQCWQQNMT